MTSIGLLSDTHSFLDPSVFRHFENCDEIWHAGDFGDENISKLLSEFKPLRGVYGNVDGRDIRSIHPAEQNFICDGLKVYMTHIGGYPGNYSPGIKQKIEKENPMLFICGHSHILKIMPDKNLNLLHINPGAAGIHGFHKFRTMVRFKINDGKILEPEVIELGLRGVI